MILTWQHWAALSPILFTSAAIVAVLLAIAIKRDHFWNVTAGIAFGNLAWIAVAVLFFGPLVAPETIPAILPLKVTPLLVIDNYALFYFGIIIVCTLACATLLQGYLEGYSGNKEEMYLLLALSALGAMVLVASCHFASFFIGLELMSIPLYAMIAYPHRSRRSLEGGLKYLVLSAAASSFILFGIALIYSLVGSLSFAAVGTYMAQPGPVPGIVTLGGALFLVGIGFKLSLVPFHLWTPDVYEGAPAPVTSFLATASKTAVFAVLLRYYVEARGHEDGDLIQVLTVLAILSMLVGNVLALLQNNVKRMLAYSSVAHFGYCLVALIASGPLAVEAVGAYLITYVVTTLGVLGVVTLISSPYNNDGDADELEDYRGLFWRRPYISSILTALLLSLAGIPVTAGFVGKFYVIAAGVDSQEWWLLGAVVLGSAIGLFYYLRLMIVMFMDRDRQQRFEAPLNWGLQTGGAMVVAVTLASFVLGLYPQPFIEIIQLAPLVGP
ncbi:MAG: NADH:ubiquinone oxidoreductase subunit [Panacagrimonas sp.]|nr:NADH-quinone oxidoreductase subunit NuoN [Panacagrimonas sp.]MCC2657136.1 NADH:ubiquinone oxidoreductase subunit [Panacagrimonas sp.]